MSFPWSWFHIRKKRLISGCTGIPTIYKFLGVLAICVVIYIITPDTLPPESTPTTRSENSEDETLTFDSDDAAVTTSSNSSPDSTTRVPDKLVFQNVEKRFVGVTDKSADSVKGPEVKKPMLKPVTTQKHPQAPIQKQPPPQQPPPQEQQQQQKTLTLTDKRIPYVLSKNVIAETKSTIGTDVEADFTTDGSIVLKGTKDAVEKVHEALMLEL
eukprot:381696_1